MYNKLDEDELKPNEYELISKPDENENKLNNTKLNERVHNRPEYKPHENEYRLKPDENKHNIVPKNADGHRKIKNIIIFVVVLAIIIVFLSIFLPLYLTKHSYESAPSASTPTPISTAFPSTNSTYCTAHANSWVCGNVIGLDAQSIYWCQYNSTIGANAHCVSSQCISSYCESGIGPVNAIAYPWGISCGSAINVTSQPNHLFLGNNYTQLMDLGLCATGCCVQSFGTNDKCC
jgi:hypothetical protein